MKQQMHLGKCEKPGVVKEVKGTWGRVERDEFEKVIRRDAMRILCDKLGEVLTSEFARKWHDWMCIFRRFV